jgi:hypothetical protein
MNSTKVLESSYPKQFSDLFWKKPVFKVTKLTRHCLKEPFDPKPFPLKKEHVANPSNMFVKEEEKGTWIYHNQENLNINHNINAINNVHKSKDKKNIKTLQKLQQVGLVKIEKEVKLTDFEINHQLESDEYYTEERVALENEYGLPSDNIFEINETEEFENQPEFAESYQNLNNSHPMNQEYTKKEEEQPSTETCDGLKKGIDNDALFADVSTMDGLSMFGDLLEIVEKKIWEDEELENIEIFFPDLIVEGNASENLTHFDCTISKGHEEDLEEEKIDTHVNKTTSEIFPLVVDFQEDDYEMSFESAFYNPLIEQSVPLMKKQSYRLNRGFSLFEDAPEMFAEDPSNRHINDTSRQRSYSKFTEDEWYKMDWRNPMMVDQPDTYLNEIKDVAMCNGEPDYFKKFDDVLVGEDETPELYEISEHFGGVKVVDKIDHLDTFSENFKELISIKDDPNDRNFQIMNTDEEHSEFSKTPVVDISKAKIFGESSCF